MGFSNLENIWSELSSQYQNTQTDFETSLQQHNTDGQLDSTLADVQSEREDRGMIQYMTDVNWSIDPETGLATFSSNPTLPEIEIVQPEGIINRWSDPITFSLFAAPALMGFPQPKDTAELFDGYQGEFWGQTNFNDITSNYSIFNPPQEVDFFQSYDPLGVEQVGGYFANHEYPKTFFNGISDTENGTGTFGIVDGGTHFYLNSDYGSHPGPVDMFHNIKATGFTNNLVHKSPSQFKGVTESGGVYDWDNGIMQGDPGSVYGIESPGPPTDPQEVDYFPNTNAIGFSAKVGINNSESQFIGVGSGLFGGSNFDGLTEMYKGQNVGEPTPGEVDFFGGINSYYSEVNPFVPGFTAKFNQGGYGYGNDDEGNSLYIGIDTGTHTSYHDLGMTFINQETIGNDYLENTHALGFTSTMETTQFVGVGENNQWNSTSLLDQYTNFSGNYNTDGSVNFFGGNNSYYQSVGSGSGYDGVPGFHENYNPVFPGGYSIENPQGDTKYKGVRSWSIYDTFDLENLQSYDTFYNSLIDTVNEETGEIIPSIGVDYFDGKSLHPASFAQDGYFIQGFNRRYNPGFFGGWSADNVEGDSKLLGLWNQIGYDNQVLTSMWNGLFVDTISGSSIQPNSTINFNDIPPYEEPVFPGGYSTENSKGNSHFIGDIAAGDDETTLQSAINPNIYADNYQNIPNGYEVSVDTPIDTVQFTGNSPSLFYFYSNLLQNGLPAGDVWAGQESNQGGAPSKQHGLLYSDEAWTQKAGEHKYLGEPQAGSNFVAADRFDIKNDMHNSGWRVGRTDSITHFGLSAIGIDNLTAYGNANEPYIVDHIGMEDDATFDNIEGWAPMTTIKKDSVRISKFLASSAGTQWIANQELLSGFQLYKSFYDVGSTLLNVATPNEGFILPMVNFTRDTGIAGGLVDLAAATTYTEYLENRSLGLQMVNLGASSDKTYAERSRDNLPMMMQINNTLENWSEQLVDAVWDAFTPPAASTNEAAADNEAIRFKHQVAGINKKSGVSSANNMQKAMSAKTTPLGNLGKGDIHTLMPIHDTMIEGSGGGKVAQHGMPFYFRDLRDNKIVVFRAYIEGLSETISPSWNSEIYVGRSEPVYSYSSTEREVNFTLKLMAQTKDELNQIWTKMNRLTSMTYPAYKGYEEVVVKENPGDETGTLVKFGAIGDKTRMKPPLTRLRLGDLYGTAGSDSAEITGFIKSLSYSYPDNGVWEIQEGYQVPKYIEVEIGYQIIHSTVPSLDFALKAEPNLNFYGINNTLFNSAE